MPDINYSVGTNAVNMAHDTALVEALLTVVRRNNGRGYMGQYDGRVDAVTRNAITTFQQDHGIVARPGAAATPPTAGARRGSVGQESPGTVNPFGPTMTRLNQLVAHGPHEHVRIIPGTTVVYWPAEPAEATISAAAIRGNGNLDAAFREQVAQLVERMYSLYKIALSVTDSGGLRTFAQQYNLATVPRKNKQGKFYLVTGAGPGESNHNFGMAVDIGFKNFKWMKGNGAPTTDDWWLNNMTGVKSLPLWKVRNAVAKQFKLFPTALKGDLIHLQNFDDANINMRNSLAQLLNLVGTMRWKVKGEIYSSDLGLGGAFYPHGRSEDVWALKSNLTAAQLGAAQNAAGAKVQNGARDVTDMKAKLKAEFELAEANRHRWVPVP